MNIYKEVIRQSLPRLLNLYDHDPASLTCGNGDRIYWGWKTIDFSNATMQGGAHSLSLALKLGLIDNEPFILKMIDNIFQVIPKISSRRGGLNEAYPGEDSFCVTALVAFDLLSAIRHLQGKISREQKEGYLNKIAPGIGFLAKHDETHAFISNHLATAAAALALWQDLSGVKSPAGEKFLERILSRQSSEGWYPEYQGADPGYQTLCMYYLYELYNVSGDKRLKNSLLKSLDFLKYFIHPDATLGGLYGSRNTEVYYPAGLVGLSSLSGEASLLVEVLEKGISRGYHLLPPDIDSNNFVPLLNSYSVAALYQEQKERAEADRSFLLPFQKEEENEFAQAGLFIKSTRRYYAIVNYKKGGTLKVFDKSTGKIDIEDGGLFGELKNGVKFTTQVWDDTLRFGNKEITASFYQKLETGPSPLSFILLRVLALTLFRIPAVHAWFKKLIVKMLMTGKKMVQGSVLRRFIFDQDSITVKEEIRMPQGCKKIGHPGRARAIHMASSGYYVKQMEDVPEVPVIVKFL